MPWLLASILSLVCFSAVVLGTFVPLRDARGLHYLFVSPAALNLLAAATAASVLVVGVFTLTVRRSQRHAPHLAVEARSGRWLAPLAAVGLVAFGILPAAPGIGEKAAFLSYYLYDLRWWWLATAVILTAVHADRLTGGAWTAPFRRIDRWSSHTRLLLFDALLMAAVIGCAVATTRHLRFDPEPTGDEPKYIRYAEIWYQGRGLQVSGHRPFSEAPLDMQPNLGGNIAAVWRAVREERAALATDVRAFVSDPAGFQWNRARKDGGIVHGKRGGVYQIYLPGVSVLLFPGYFVDRHVLGVHASGTGEFPSDLTLSHVTLLLLHGACAVALFRLLRHALASDVLALVWSAVAMLTLPAAAFAFQFYPELLALLVITTVTTYVWFHARAAGPLAAAAAGAAAASLAWLHPRFLLVSVILVLTAAWRTSVRRSRTGLLAGAALAYLSVMFFCYRVTGSWLPTALWNAPGGEPALHFASAPVGVVGYALHHTWGMAPHTPILLAALPGLAIMAREEMPRALFLVAVVLSLVVPAAAHTLHAAGSTPGRLIVAVVPLLIWPVALVARRFWAAPAVRAATIVAVVVSLEAAVSYNWHHLKAFGAMRSTGASGWRLNLAFPQAAGPRWSESPWNLALLGLLLAAIAAMTAAAYAASRQTTAGPGSSPSLSRAQRGRRIRTTAVLAGIVLVSGAATAFNGEWTRDTYLRGELQAWTQAAAALADRDRCRFCFATRAPAIDWRWLEPNTTTGIEVETHQDGASTTVQIVLQGSDADNRFGRVRADFGDGSGTSWIGIVGERRLVHRYRQPGQYSLVVWLQLRNGEMRADRRTLTVTGS